MATTEIPRYSARDIERDASASRLSVAGVLRAILAPLASLRLTVALLAMALVLVLAGTLAQIDYEIWRVVGDYFRTWLAWIEVRIFFPRRFDISPSVVFPFPGGKTLGLALAINLLAAHSVRFRVAARGRRLAVGVALVAVGAAITYAVIASGSNTTIESELSESFANGLWHALRASVGAAALTLGYVLALNRQRAGDSSTRWIWWIGAVSAVLLAVLAGYLFTHPEARLNASGLRILWQLAKATGASIVLGLGCWALFNKRAGIVLLHSGVALLMFSELWTAERAVEARMSITEGETVNYANDIRSIELAVIDVSDPKVDRETTISEGLLTAGDGRISHGSLPFDMRIVELMGNSSVRLIQPGEGPARATAGHGQLRVLEEIPESNGVGTDQPVDMPAAYVELLAKGGDESLGIYLLRPFLNGEIVKLGDKSYEVALRFKKLLKPYLVTLKDFKFDRYVGTDTPKNFESVVRFQDPAQHIDYDGSISMNNPIRYGGDTLYQADWDKRTEKTTELQVVSNTGWMIPYVACMIVAAGMLVHFGQAIVRFTYRREDEARRESVGRVGNDGSLNRNRRLTLSDWRRPAVWAPALLVLSFGAYALKSAVPPHDKFTEMKIHEFGKLPAAYGGRTQPMDTLATNALRVISRKATFKDEDGEKQPAIRWLMDVAAQNPAYLKHKVIRIDNLDVLKLLDLPRRDGFCYSIAELLPQAELLEKQVKLAREVPEEKQNLMQKKLLELDARTRTVMVLMDSFGRPDIGGETREEILASFQSLVGRIAALNQSAPRPVPPVDENDTWKTLMEAEKDALVASLDPAGKAKGNEAATMLRAILTAYRENKPQEFNAQLAGYEKLVAERAVAEAEHEQKLADRGETSGRKPAERLILGRLDFEAFYNHFDPFFLCIILYLTAFVLAALAWLGWAEGFNRAANWLLWLTFGLHTFGLVCRIYISGRPPITNLYSSAVFIGWAAVLFALVFETIYKFGVGNLLAAIIGFPTMVIAFYLAFDGTGDTIGVMQAVLDTNFWLATHVVCITLGYSTTLLAGALGAISILLGYVGGRLNTDQHRQLTRMTYGTLCFAIFFSFIGTVLGGLWADDSWGRFWGWDPKENGALMIVIWNAIVLHARWGKMIGERGLASLAVLGNIVTAWSWFGVNEMGVGLHAYGFTEGRAFKLGVFMVSQLIVAGLAWVGTRGERVERMPAKTAAT